MVNLELTRTWFCTMMLEGLTNPMPTTRLYFECPNCHMQYLLKKGALYYSNGAYIENVAGAPEWQRLLCPCRPGTPHKFKLSETTRLVSTRITMLPTTTKNAPDRWNWPRFSIGSFCSGHAHGQSPAQVRIDFRIFLVPSGPVIRTVSAPIFGSAVS